MKEVKQVIKKYLKYADCGIFFSSNIVGDPMEMVYQKNGVTILICRYWAYFEIFGLTPHEQEEAKAYYNSLRNRR